MTLVEELIVAVWNVYLWICHLRDFSATTPAFSSKFPSKRKCSSPKRIKAVVLFCYKISQAEKKRELGYQASVDSVILCSWNSWTTHSSRCHYAARRAPPWRSAWLIIIAALRRSHSTYKLLQGISSIVNLISRSLLATFSFISQRQELREELTAD